MYTWFDCLQREMSSQMGEQNGRDAAMNINKLLKDINSTW